MSYSRLDTPIPQPTKKLLWFFTKAASHTYHAIPKSMSGVKHNNNGEQVEREWLLLGEPPNSIKPDDVPQDAESSILSDPSTSDIECIGKVNENSESESSTDIDAIVDEYRQKIKVTAIGQNDVVRTPSSGSWWIASVLVATVVLCTIGIICGIVHDSYETSYGCLTIILVATLTLLILPKYQTSVLHPSTIPCSLCIMMSGVFLGIIISECWAPLLFWFTAALLFFVRIDKYCCLCLERRTNDVMSEVLISSSNLHGNGSTSIRIPANQQNLIVSEQSVHCR